MNVIESRLTLSKVSSITARDSLLLRNDRLYKKDLKDFTPEDKIVNRFEEILRHNNVSDKENAFNRLVALFICKLVDEITKNEDDEVEFQYKQGTDDYESLQDRLQRLHTEGMYNISSYLFSIALRRKNP